MKWIGQNIQDFISRFRNYIYVEKADVSTSVKALVIDGDGKVGTNSAFTLSGVTSVTVGPAGASSGVVTTITPNVGSVIVTPNVYGGTTKVGHVPAGGLATTFLRGDGTWVTPTNTTYLAATSTTLGLVKLWDNTVQTAVAAVTSATPSRTYGIQFNASNQAVVNVPWTDSGVRSFTNSNGVFVSNSIVNTAATGDVDIGRVDLSATGLSAVPTVSVTQFLRGDNTWAVPNYTIVNTFSNTFGTYIGGNNNALGTGNVTLGTVDLNAVDGTSDETTRFLSKDNTWDVPTYSPGTVTSVGVAVGTGISVAMNSGSNPITSAGEFLLTNTGVTSNVAGTGISVSGATGAVTIGNTGVTSIVAGINISVSGATGAVTVNSTDQYVGTVTNVSSTNTNILTVANPTTTPALSPVMGTVTAGSTGLVTGGQVDTAIDARYTYSYFSYAFRCSLTNDGTTEYWFFPSDDGITDHQWTNRDVGSAAPSAIALAATITVDRYSFQSGIFIPQTCVFAGFYGTVRMSNNAPNTAHPVIAMFYNAPIPNGSTTNITPACIAFDTTAGSGNRLNRMNVVESNQESTLVAGGLIFPAFGQDVAITSIPAGTARGQITLKFKTLIP